MMGGGGEINQNKPCATRRIALTLPAASHLKPENSRDGAGTGAGQPRTSPPPKKAEKKLL